MSYALQTMLNLTADHFAGVRTRRIMAYGLDLCFIAVLTLITWILLGILGIPTLGLAWHLIPLACPIVAFFYNGLTVSGAGRGTWGMRAMDLEVRQMQNGSRATFIHAALQAILFYVSWSFPLIFLVTLFTRDKRYLHDMLSGVVIMRRSQEM